LTYDPEWSPPGELFEWTAGAAFDAFRAPSVRRIVGPNGRRVNSPRAGERKRRFTSSTTKRTILHQALLKSKKARRGVRCSARAISAAAGGHGKLTIVDGRSRPSGEWRRRR